MKKFLLSLASVVMFASAASATTVYFENTANWSDVNAYCWDPEVAGWPGTAVTTTVEASGRTFYAYEVPGAQQNIIFNNGGDSGKTKNLKVVDGAVYSAANTTSIDPIGSIANGVFTPAGEVVVEYATLYVPASDWQFDVCNIYSWDPVLFGSWPGAAMTKTTVDGTAYWSIKIDKREIDGVTVGGWKLNAGAGKDESDNVTNGTVFKDGYAYSLNGTSTEVGGGDQPGPGPEVTPLYLLGASTGWAPAASNQMTGDAEGNYTISLPTLIGEFKITSDFVDGQWNDDLTFSACQELELGTEYTCKSAIPAMANMSIAGLGAKDVTVSFNIDTKVIKVTGTAITEVVTKYFIKGNFYDAAWPSDELVKNAEGLYSATITPTTEACSFIVYKTNDGVEAAWYKGVEAVVGQTVTMSTDGSDATVSLEAGKEYVFTFDPETLALTVDKTSGVADIEAAEELPAVYYNLQGVRVANPENGLYLEVRGNNVRKVVK